MLQKCRQSHRPAGDADGAPGGRPARRQPHHAAARSSCGASAVELRERGARRGGDQPAAASTAARHRSQLTLPPRAGAGSTPIRRASRRCSPTCSTTPPSTRRRGGTDPPRRSRATASEAVIAVRDNGIGIDAELLPQRLRDVHAGRPSRERSARAASASAWRWCRRLVELHGGSVERAERRAPAGQRVRRAPAARAPAPRAAPRRAPPAAAHDRARRMLRGRRQRRCRREPGARCCACSATRCAVAHDGADGARDGALSSGRTSCCSTSACPAWTATRWRGACAPRMSGPQLKLVALTGWTQEEDRRRTREAGFDAHLAKPVDVASLQALL